MPKVAICTVNFNGKKDTLEFLESLQKLDTRSPGSGQASELETRVFVVDGGSTDGSVEAIKALNLKPLALDLILRQENRGSAGGYNDGAKEALKWGADFIVLFNNDTLIGDKNLIKDLIKTANSDPTIGAVAPKIYFAPSFEFYKERYSKKDEGNVIWYAGGSFDWNNVLSSHRGIDEVDSGKYNLVEETKFANTACILIKKEVFEKGVFFDEDLFAYLDDNDFNQKMALAGFKLYFDGLTSLFHKVSRTAGIGSPTSDYYLSRNRLIFGFKYASLRTKFALLREALKLLISGRENQKKGVIDFFTGKRGGLS